MQLRPSTSQPPNPHPHSPLTFPFSALLCLAIFPVCRELLSSEQQSLQPRYGPCPIDWFCPYVAFIMTTSVHRNPSEPRIPYRQVQKHRPNTARTDPNNFEQRANTALITARAPHGQVRTTGEYRMNTVRTGLNNEQTPHGQRGSNGRTTREHRKNTVRESARRQRNAPVWQQSNCAMRIMSRTPGFSALPFKVIKNLLRYLV